VDKDAPIGTIGVIERMPRPARAAGMVDELRRLVARVRQERPFLAGYELADVSIRGAGPDLRVALAFVPLRRNQPGCVEPLTSGR